MPASDTLEVTTPQGKKIRTKNLQQVARDFGIPAHFLHDPRLRRVEGFQGWRVKIWRVNLSQAALELDEKRTTVAENKIRKCIRCRDEFESKWIGNRLCGRCNQWALSNSAQLI